MISQTECVMYDRCWIKREKRAQALIFNTAPTRRWLHFQHLPTLCTLQTTISTSPPSPNYTPELQRPANPSKNPFTTPTSPTLALYHQIHNPTQINARPSNLLPTSITTSNVTSSIPPTSTLPTLRTAASITQRTQCYQLTRPVFAHGAKTTSRC